MSLEHAPRSRESADPASHRRGSAPALPNRHGGVGTDAPFLPGGEGIAFAGDEPGRRRGEGAGPPTGPAPIA